MRMIRSLVCVAAAALALPPLTARAQETPGETPSAPEATPGENVATPEEKAEPELKVNWKNGKTSIETPNALLQISNRVQLRWTQDWPETDDATGSFRVRRAKTKLEGWIYEKRFMYALQLNWADRDNVLEDALIDWDFTGNGLVRATLGQFKVPFGRQELTSSGKQQFVDRAIVSRQFAHGRDVGLRIHGETSAGRLSWAAGIFNGSGRDAVVNTDGKYEFDARVQFAPNGDPGYSESDFESKDRPLYSVAGQYHHNDVGRNEERVKRSTYGFDGVFKFHGVSAFAEAFFSDVTLNTNPALVSNGFTVQLGYLFPGRRFEVAGRYSWWDPSDDTDGNDRRELGGAVSYFRNEHNLKFQADLLRVEGGVLELDDTLLRFQTQFIF